MKTHLRNAAKSGIVFGIIIIFLPLVGFTITGAVMLGKLFGEKIPSNTVAPVEYIILFLGLIALWNGWKAGNDLSETRQKLSSSLIAGFLAGITSFVVVLLFDLVIAFFISREIDPRTYLSALSPVAMKYFFFNLPVLQGIVSHLFLFSIIGALGGMLSWMFSLRGWRTFTQTAKSGFGNVLSDGNPIGRMIHSPWFRYFLYAVAILVMIILPRQWGSYWNYVFGTVGIYILLGLGLNIIVGYSGQLVLGYVTFFAIGAYTVALLNAPIPHNLNWGFWIALIIGIALAAIGGMLVGLPILRLRGDYLAIVTLGFGEIIRILLKSDLLTSFTGGPRGIQDIKGPVLFGKAFSSDVDFMYMILIAVALLVFITTRLQASRTGRAWLSMREDETVSQATGVDKFYYKLLALAIGAAFAGLGGVLFASRNQFTGPEDHNLMVSINVLCLVIVGGMGSIPGIILGAFVLKGLPEILRDLENYRMLVFGALLVVMMIARPEGLWPAKSSKLEKPLESPPVEELTLTEEAK